MSETYRTERHANRRYDLKTPCKNCPFRNDDTRIVFAARERAEEIAEGAYRNGFPCHLSAEYIEDDLGDTDGFEFGQDTQYCAGHMILMLKDNCEGAWPGIDNDEGLVEWVADRIGDYWNAPVFETEEDFINANSEEDERWKRLSIAR